MSQRLPVNNFKLVEHISEFDESFIKNYNEESDEEYFLEVEVQYNKIYIIFTLIYLFCLKE